MIRKWTEYGRENGSGIVVGLYMLLCLLKIERWVVAECEYGMNEMIVIILNGMNGI